MEETRADESLPWFKQRERQPHNQLRLFVFPGLTLVFDQNSTRGTPPGYGQKAAGRVGGSMELLKAFKSPFSSRAKKNFCPPILRFYFDLFSPPPLQLERCVRVLSKVRERESEHMLPDGPPETAYRRPVKLDLFM